MIREIDHKFEEKFCLIDKKLSKICDILQQESKDSTQGVHSKVGEENDRKRLKERLTEAINHGRIRSEQHSGDWKERLFGICNQDNRLGKEGSRQ